METAECHVLLHSAINQSSLLDRCNFAQRMKTALVSALYGKGRHTYKDFRTHNSSLEGAMKLKFAPFCSS